MHKLYKHFNSLPFGCYVLHAELLLNLLVITCEKEKGPNFVREPYKFHGAKDGIVEGVFNCGVQSNEQTLVGAECTTSALPPIVLRWWLLPLTHFWLCGDSISVANLRLIEPLLRGLRSVSLVDNRK